MIVVVVWCLRLPLLLAFGFLFIVRVCFVFSRLFWVLVLGWRMFCLFITALVVGSNSVALSLFFIYYLFLVVWVLLYFVCLMMVCLCVVYYLFGFVILFCLLFWFTC